MGVDGASASCGDGSYHLPVDKRYKSTERSRLPTVNQTESKHQGQGG